MILENDKVEKILCTLDSRGYIFPGYEIEKINNQPHILGTGGFARVYEINCLNRPDKRYVVKVIGFEKHVMSSKNFWETVNIQSSLSDVTPYICRLISAKEIYIILDEKGELLDVAGSSQDKDCISVQFILMEKLEEIVERNRFGNIILKREELLNEDKVIEFGIQVGQALYYAHKANVLHRDVKLENIFWDATGSNYQLGDFGLAKYTIEGIAETKAYTDGYGAPEIKRHLYDSYNATADIYSFGITLYLLLNDLKFPGSEGYYVNFVQYNPEFVFPAPLHASEGMVRIIRKMCQFYPEDRYKSMDEVLMDLSEYIEEKRKNVENEALELSDAETETYGKDTEVLDLETVTYGKDIIYDEDITHKRARVLEGRFKRKADERNENKIYNKLSAGFLGGFTLVITFLIGSFQTDNTIVQNWQFWVLPVMALIEIILLKVKEFHVTFGVITLVVGVVMCLTRGISVPNVVLIGSIITGIPILIGGSVAATTIWAVMAANGNLQWINFIEKFDLDWILLVILFTMMFLYWGFRIVHIKTKHIKFKIEAIIVDKIYWVMIVAGIIMLIMKQFGSVQIPDIFQRIHLIRTGVVSLAIYLIIKAYCLFFSRERE